MDITDLIIIFIFMSQAWTILGILLVGAEILDGNMFAFPIGVAALVMAFLIHGQNEFWFGEIIFFESWRGVLIGFSFLSVISVGALKYIFRLSVKKKASDINKY